MVKVVGIMDVNKKVAFEYTFMGIELNRPHINAVLLRNNVGYFIHDAQPVEPFQPEACEVRLFFKFGPLCSNNPVAMARKKLFNLPAPGFVDDNMIVCTQVPDHLVAGNGVAAFCQCIGNIILCFLQEKRLFFVNDIRFFTGLGYFFFLLFSAEGDVPVFDKFVG